MSKARPLLALPIAASLALGCVGYSNTDIHQDRQPEVHTGAGAVILWPGQAPAMPPPPSMPPAGGPQQQSPSGASGPTGQAAPGGGAPATASSGGAAPSIGDGGFTYIGGAGVHENTDTHTKSAAVGAPQIPILNILLWPFGAIGAALGGPAVKHAVKLEQQPGQTQQSQSGAAPPAQQPSTAGAATDPQGAYEQSRLDDLQRELASRGVEKGASAEKSSPSVSSAPSTSAPAGAAASSPTPRSSSIADELAALQGSAAPPSPSAPVEAPAGGGRAPSAGHTDAATAAPPPSAPRASGPPSQAEITSLMNRGVADEVTDDNGDGRPDHWIYRQNGHKVREVFDVNGDGKPDRMVLYDPKTGEKVAVEEDTNLDGRIDTWIEYQNGKIARQRRDTNHDGFPDTWSYYDANGVLTRQEQDRNGDGFRDRIEIYKDGKLARVEEDTNGDGKIDVVKYYDAEQRIVRVDEDRDGDGLIDTRSYYKDGKLARREFVSEAALAKPIESEQLSTPAWSEDAKPSGTH